MTPVGPSRAAPPPYAILVPGQGAQRPGMLGRLGQDEPAAAVLAEASAWVGDRLGGTLDQLDTDTAQSSTVGAQLGLLVAGVASGRAITSVLGPPGAVAGHSVGGFAAAVLAGALDLGDALSLVHLRATAMERLFPDGFGMVALRGVGEGGARTLVERVGAPAELLWVASINSDDEVVLGGSLAALSRLGQGGEAALGGLRRLDVAVPSHGEPLRPVAEQLAAAMAGLAGATLAVPWVAGASGRLLRRTADVRAELAREVAEPVRWRDVVATLLEHGFAPLVQTHPGCVLVGLAREGHGPVALAHAEVSTADLPLAVNRLRR